MFRGNAGRGGKEIANGIDEVKLPSFEYLDFLSGYLFPRRAVASYPHIFAL